MTNLIAGNCFCARRIGNGQDGDGRRGVRGSGNPLRIPMGIHRLPNGNTVFGNYIGHGFTGKQPMLFEVTPDKKVVWEFADHAHFKTVCQVQIIDAPADPLKGEVLR